MIEPSKYFLCMIYHAVPFLRSIKSQSFNIGDDPYTPTWVRDFKETRWCCDVLRPDSGGKNKAAVAFSQAMRVKIGLFVRVGTRN